MFLVLCAAVVIFVTVVSSLGLGFSWGFLVHLLCLLFYSDKIIEMAFLLLNQASSSQLYLPG